jgi:hypothetical protein
MIIIIYYDNNNKSLFTNLVFEIKKKIHFIFVYNMSLKNHILFCKINVRKYLKFLILISRDPKIYKHMPLKCLMMADLGSQIGWVQTFFL